MENNDKLKVSRYTFFIEKTPKFYLYNSMSNALLEVDEELHQLLRYHKDNDEFIKDSLEKDIIDSLQKSHFVTKNDEDLFLISLVSR